MSTPHTTAHTPDLATQDCSCVTHTGPHWIHMARIEREQSRELAQRALDAKQAGDGHAARHALQALAQAEARRLANITAELRRAGVDNTDALPLEIRALTRLGISLAQDAR